MKRERLNGHSPKEHPTSRAMHANSGRRSTDEPPTVEVLPPQQSLTTRRSSDFVNGRFAPGNRVGLGNPGPSPRPKFLTQELISQLNELDVKSGKTKYGKIIENLIKNATGYVLKTKTTDEDGNVVIEEREIPHDLEAIRQIFDRLEGKPMQSVGLGVGENTGKLTIVFESVDQEL